MYRHGHGTGIGIYFSWDQGTGRDIWRAHVKNGSKEQITHGGAGWVGRESSDEQSIFYQLHIGDAALAAQPLTGGESRTIIRCVAESVYAVAAQGIYYVPCPDGVHHGADSQLLVRNPVTLQDQRYGTLEKFENGGGGLAVSPDGEMILYTRLVSDGADLMLIQNFR